MSGLTAFLILISGSVNALADEPTLQQKVAIEDLMKVERAANACGYEINTGKVTGDLGMIGMSFADVSKTGRFWPYVTSVYPKFLSDLRSAQVPHDVECAGWSLGFGPGAPIKSHENWLVIH